MGKMEKMMMRTRSQRTKRRKILLLQLRFSTRRLSRQQVLVNLQVR